jgi:hypothetical protein
LETIAEISWELEQKQIKKEHLSFNAASIERKRHFESEALKIAEQLKELREETAELHERRAELQENGAELAEHRQHSRAIKSLHGRPLTTIWVNGLPVDATEYARACHERGEAMRKRDEEKRNRQVDAFCSFNKYVPGRVE